jgi:hypothetical protein
VLKGCRVIALLILDFGAGRGGWSAPRPGCFTPGKHPVPILQEAGWAPGPVWTCAKNLLRFCSYLVLHCSGIGLSMFVCIVLHCSWIGRGDH